MTFNEIIVADLESDGLLDSITKIHCLGAAWRDDIGKWALRTTTDYEDIKKMFTNPNNIIAGHNFYQYDTVAVSKVLGIEVKAQIIDTLALSYALFPERKMGTHGLESWGDTFSIPKPEIKDWKNLTIEDYLHRVSEDVKINVRLIIEIEKRLTSLYGDDKKKAMAFCKYMSFKADCLREQEANPVKIDTEKAQKTLKWMEKIKEEKIQELIPAMPKAVSSRKSKPAKMTKKDGSLSAAGKAWLELLQERGLPEDHEEDVEMYKTPNPNSSQQIKDWLFTLGWKPKIFNEGASGKIPQIRNKDKELCKSVLKLADKEPAINALEGISVLTHRIGVLKSFLKHVSFNDTVVARVTAFTNTLRCQHAAPIANLPKVISKGPDKDSIKDGKWIRGIMIAPEGYLFCGSDMASLEDRMKQHYIYQYDKEYVHEMMTPDFDPHLDLAVAAGALTQEQADAHKRGEEDHGAIRHIYKTCNYAAVYKIGAKSLSKVIGKSIDETQEVLDSYWSRNWAVDRAAEDFKVKHVDGQMWMLNPVNGFYYNLRSEKDKFSLACQGGGTFIFDTWVHFMRSKGVKVILSYHDEIANYVIDSELEKERVEGILHWAVEQVNKTLKLNRNMEVDVKFGKSYADVH